MNLQSEIGAISAAIDKKAQIGRPVGVCCSSNPVSHHTLLAQVGQLARGLPLRQWLAPFVILMMAPTMALSSESVLISRTKDWSILSLYTLNFFR